MTTGLHENLGRAEEIQVGSDRGFGLIVGGIVLLIAAWRTVFGELGWLEGGLGALGGLLVAFGLLAPARLAPLNRLWTRLGVLLAKVVSPIGLGLIFALAVVPTGLIIRLLGKDPLHLCFDRGAPSYWIRREPPGPDPKTMPRQF